MSKFIKIFLAILIFGSIFTFPVTAQQAWTKADLQSIYVEYLRNEGYLPSIDVDGDIQFKVSGYNYFIIIDENDLQFFQVYTGFSLGASSLENVAIAVNFTNRRSKVAKIAVSSDGRVASITAELLLNDPRDFKPVFARTLSLIRNAENNFLSYLRELDGVL